MKHQFNNGHRPKTLKPTAPQATLHLGDCLAWMESRAANSIQAIVTDPPYGLKEYSTVEKEKLRNGHGGVWRIPPSFGLRPKSGAAFHRTDREGPCRSSAILLRLC